MFDPNQFLEMSFEGSNDTKAIPIPVGDYQAIITEVKTRQWQSKDGEKSGIALDLVWSIEDEALKTLLGRDTITCKQGIMLDLTDTGGIDMGKGKNIGLGRLREAVDLNDSGRAITFSMLPGRMALIKVSHRVSGEDIFAEVKHVTRLGE